MKLNLLDNSPDVRAGYRNIDGHAVPGDGKVYGHVTALDDLVEDAEATEIVALNLIDRWPQPAGDGAIAHWVKKLRKGGTLTLSGLDLREAARLLAGRRLTYQDAHDLIYGGGRKSARCLDSLQETFAALGLKVTFKSYQGTFYTITGQRP